MTELPPDVVEVEVEAVELIDQALPVPAQESLADRLAAKSKKKPIGLAYSNPSNKRFVLSNGVALETVAGVITPTTPEEKELCAYFESIGKLELVGG